MKRRRTGTVIPAGYRHEVEVFACGDKGACQCCCGARAAARAIHDRLAAGRNGNAGTEESLHTRCLSTLRRRNPERPGHHLLPAAAEGEPQRGLPGGVRAVRIMFARLAAVSGDAPARGTPEAWSNLRNL